MALAPRFSQPQRSFCLAQPSRSFSLAGRGAPLIALGALVALFSGAASAQNQTASSAQTSSTQLPKASSQPREASSQLPKASSQLPKASSQLPEASSQLPKASSQQAAVPTHVYADAFTVWIYETPEISLAPIGMLRAGQSVALRSHSGAPPEQRVKRGCGRGWYAVEPAGFVCMDQQLSFSPTRYSESMARLLPKSGPFPFEYALSMGTESYRRLPTPSEWERRERIFGPAKVRPLPPHWQGHEELVSNDALPLGPHLNFLENGGSVSRASENRLRRREVPFGSMLALSGSFEHAGRSFGQSADGTVVGMDRMRVFRHSDFAGIELGEELSLPVAWARKRIKTYSLSNSAHCLALAQLHERAEHGRLRAKAPQLKKECLVPQDEWLDARTPQALWGDIVDVAGTRFVSLKRGEQVRLVPLRLLFLAEQDAPASNLATDAKWIHFSISQGTLTSYLGSTPLFTTLASPGIGGTPAPGADPLDTRTTPVGSYRINFKYVSDDMSPEVGEHRKFWIADVPYAMYFKQPFAIHVAYWHESFGEPMSGGCINVSPRDGARLFSWTDPPLPQGWYGVGASAAFGHGTTVVIER